MSDPNPIEVYRRLIRICGPFFETHRDGDVLQKYFREGKVPPAHLLPGGLINELSQADRDALKKLTSDEVSKERLI